MKLPLFLELQHRRRKADFSLHLAVIGLTARAMKGNAERCLKAGMDGYLSKPIRPQELDGSKRGRGWAALGTTEDEILGERYPYATLSKALVNFICFHRRQALSN
jgi:CheY-like chemotaxis protein